MNQLKLLILFIFALSYETSAQHTIKVRKELKIDGLYKNNQNKDNLPTYLYFTEEGVVLYTFSKKLKDKRALIKLTLCSLDSTCYNYPKTTYSYNKRGHIRFTTNADVNRKYFIIYDGQFSNNRIELSIRKEESNQLIIVNKYILVESKK